MSGLTDEKLAKLLKKQRRDDLVGWVVQEAGRNDELRRALVDFVGPQAD